MIFVGIGATAIMDVWAIIRHRWLGIPPTNWGMVGRWIAYIPRGKFYHESIAKSAAIEKEHFIGWTVHYLTGIAYCALLFCIWGESWRYNPSLLPALIIGVSTVSIPLFIMQPGMGAGIGASRTPAITKNHRYGPYRLHYDVPRWQAYSSMDA